MICKKCGSKMKHRDYVKRLVRKGNGVKEWIKIERMICPSCGYILRDLPEYLIPFKHYEKRIIEEVKQNDIFAEFDKYEDYPCEMTMKRWRSQNEHPLY